MKKISISILLILLVLIAVLFINTFTTPSRQLATNGIRKVFPIDTVAIQILQQSIQYKTVSYDNAQNRDTAAFLSLQQLFIESFPNVENTLERIFINKYSIIYHWKGKDSKAFPSALYAHLDVVPVEDANINEWQQDPWAGNIADGYIWGRGTLDDKSSAVAILTAAENLIKEGFQPDADLYFVFGHDEEIGGDEGAGAIADYFKQKGIKTKFHLDEGGMCATGMIPFVEKPVILLGTAEKGYMTVEVKVKMKGGHSSKPEKETATSVLIAALNKIESYDFPATLSPVLGDFIDYVGPEMKMPAKLLFTNKWLFKPYILYAYQQVGGEGNAVTRTTSTTTILNAGVKENTVPSEALAKINFRLLTGHKSSEVLQTLKDIVNDNRVVFSPTHNTDEASPITSTESYGFKTTQKVCADIFPDAAVSPFLMIGATDSKHFTEISQSLIRCLPVRMSKEQLSSVHGVNERIKIEDYMEMIAFYKKMMTTL